MGEMAGGASFQSLLRPNTAERTFAYVDPPFNFNAGNVSQFPPEVTGGFLLNSMCRRIGWNALAGRKLLDFGCGVRFARTIWNLAFDIDLYAGVDVNADAISWLKTAIASPHFRFDHFDMANPLYRPDGSPTPDTGALHALGLADFDGACMFSVITHQNPDEAASIFAMLHGCVKPGGTLYFTAFVDETAHDYREGDASLPRLLSTYRGDFLIDLLRTAGWTVERIYPAVPMQQTAFVCRKPLTD